MESPFACDMTALDAEQRARHYRFAEQLSAVVLEFKELPDGYAAQFSMEPETVMSPAEFITSERLCCPFFTLAACRVFRIKKSKKSPIYISLCCGRPAPRHDTLNTFRKRFLKEIEALMV